LLSGKRIKALLPGKNIFKKFALKNKLTLDAFARSFIIQRGKAGLRDKGAVCDNRSQRSECGWTHALFTGVGLFAV
jgi:hypothetical protein